MERSDSPSIRPVQDRPDLHVPVSQAPPRDSIANAGNQNSAVIAIQEWRKPGSDLSDRPALSYDPATGKHFYSLNGVQVFTD